MAAAKITKVAVVGTGVIGRSWTTLFLAKGHKVIVADPAPNAQSLLSEYIQQAWPRMERIGLSANADANNFEFVDDLTRSEHIHDIDFVQEVSRSKQIKLKLVFMLTSLENAPERVDFKTKLIGSLDAVLPESTIIASSSSGIPSSQFTGECKVNPGRVLIGHPFNPPHLIPLVEIVPHPGTSPEIVQRTMAFYESLGKAPVLIKKEVPGFLANRLQAAIIAEAYSLVRNGVASPEDVDTAMSTGPGLRWALVGPHMTNIMGGGGGKDSFAHFVSHLSPAVKSWKQDMDEKSFSFDKEDLDVVSGEVNRWVEHKDLNRVKQEMDDALLSVLEVKSKTSSLV